MKRVGQVAPGEGHVERAPHDAHPRACQHHREVPWRRVHERRHAVARSETVPVERGAHATHHVVELCEGEGVVVEAREHRVGVIGDRPVEGTAEGVADESMTQDLGDHRPSSPGLVSRSMMLR